MLRSESRDRRCHNQRKRHYSGVPVKGELQLCDEPVDSGHIPNHCDQMTRKRRKRRAPGRGLQGFRASARFNVLTGDGFRQSLRAGYCELVFWTKPRCGV